MYIKLTQYILYKNKSLHNLIIKKKCYQKKKKMYFQLNQQTHESPIHNNLQRQEANLIFSK